ncbi:MAG: hypothetical protein JW803_01575 [Endomicrobiales bacterium]|nr:hypothetical protein [Endomicrobiales bacterium]
MKKAGWKNADVEQVARIVSGELEKNGVSAVLVGGACVSIYTRNKYESSDLDYVSHADLRQIAGILENIGFKQKSGRHFERAGCPYFVEFPPPPVAIGKEVPVTRYERIKTVILLTPTDCVKDRLAAYFHWNDPQSLEQAILVAKAQRKKLDMKNIEKWSANEGYPEKFSHFQDKLLGKR